MSEWLECQEEVQQRNKKSPLTIVPTAQLPGNHHRNRRFVPRLEIPYSRYVTSIDLFPELDLHGQNKTIEPLGNEIDLTDGRAPVPRILIVAVEVHLQIMVAYRALHQGFHQRTEYCRIRLP